jgi:hypothetical protein
MGFIKDQQSLQAPWLVTAERIAMKLDNNDLGKSSLDFVVREIRQLE